MKTIRAAPQVQPFFADFSGLNAVVVALTSAVMFWLPELLALVLVGLAFLQGRIADAFM